MASKSDFIWQDVVESAVKYHELYCNKDPMWTKYHTAVNLGTVVRVLNRYLFIYKYRWDARVWKADSLRTAEAWARRLMEREKHDAPPNG
jgi:hypothetical protein